MRVIAGKFRSRQLKSVDSSLTRPTTDKNKENLFNIIGPYFDGGIALDLFAGSGGLGIEAVSRGIEQLYSVDKQYKAFQTIKDNIKTLKIEDQCFVYKADYKQVLDNLKDKGIVFDLVFLDPPYGLKINEDIITFMHENKMLNQDAIIVIEDLNEEKIEISHPYTLKREVVYGITTLQILRYEG